MKDILVLFPSKTDESTYSQITKELDEQSIEYDLKLASAHKDPDKVLDYLDEKYNIVISGAGLSAALPGFIASQIVNPVIGVPCQGNFQGLDAFLSITQMPPGIPVLGVGVQKGKLAAQYALNMLKTYSFVSLIFDDKIKPVEKAIETLKKFNISFKEEKTSKKGTINIVFTYFDEPIEDKDDLVIYCPLLEKIDDTADAALNLFTHSGHGLWVGINRGENAALAAIEILAISNKELTQKLLDYRKELRK